MERCDDCGTRLKLEEGVRCDRCWTRLVGRHLAMWAVLSVTALVVIVKLVAP